MSEKFSGVIEKLFVKFNDKTKKNSISIINQGQFYGCGLYEGKTVEVGGKALQEGWNVEFEYSTGKFKNVDMNTFKIVSEAVPKEITKKKEDDSLPMRLGNALNISAHLTKSHLDLVDIAKQVLPMVDELRNKMAEKHPEMDDFSIGSRVGQVSIIGAQFTANINDFIEVAERLFEEMCKAEESLKNEGVTTNTILEKYKNLGNNNNNNNNDHPANNIHNITGKINTGTIKEEFDWDDNIPF